MNCLGIIKSWVGSAYVLNWSYKRKPNQIPSTESISKDELFFSLLFQQRGFHTSKEVVFSPSTNHKPVMLWPWSWPWKGPCSIILALDTKRRLLSSLSFQSFLFLHTFSWRSCEQRAGQRGFRGRGLIMCGERLDSAPGSRMTVSQVSVGVCVRPDVSVSVQVRLSFCNTRHYLTFGECKGYHFLTHKNDLNVKQ